MSLGALLRAAAALRPGARDPRRELAALLRDRYRADRVVLTGSGTQALTLAIRAAREGDDAPVALPAFTCYDVATAAVGADAPVVLYDIDPDTLGPDWASLESALEAGARTVVVGYLYGIPVHWDRVTDLTDRWGATVIEDAAQGIGGSWRGRPLGSLGPMSILSFGRGKGWTGGRGGALLLRGGRTSEPDAPPTATSVSEARTLLSLAAQWLLARPSLYGLPYRLPWLHLGKTRYREPDPAAAMPRVAAAHALATAERAEAEADLRRRSARDLLPALSGADGFQLPVGPGPGTAGLLRLPCRAVDPAQRKQLLAELDGVGIAGSYPRPLGRLAVLRGRLAPEAAAPGAEALARELITFPTHSLLSPRDMAAIRSRLGA